MHLKLGLREYNPSSPLAKTENILKIVLEL